MSTLIVPCVGRKIINGIPQYLNRHPNGKLLIERSIEGVYSKEYEKVYVVILASDNDEYNAKSIIIDELRDYPLEVITLNKMTSGPAETIYQCIKKTNINGSIVVKDSDNFLKIDNVPVSNFVAGLDLNSWNRDVHNLRNKSFLIVNEQGNILDIIEKKVRSEVICLGLYGFKKANDFVNAYERLNDVSYQISSLYLSHIISYLIGYSGRVFRYVESLEYENWGDDRLWKDMQRDYALYFIDLDNILGSNCTISNSNKNKLLDLQSRGASFVGYTVEDEDYKISALRVLQSAGLNFTKIVYGCPHSEYKEIISSTTQLENKVISL